MVMYVFSNILKSLRTNQKSFQTIHKMSESTIAVCQMTATRNKERNLEIVERLTKTAAQNSAKMVFFPEASDFVGETKRDSYDLAEHIDGALIKRYKLIAQENNIWISIGGFHEKSKNLKKYNMASVNKAPDEDDLIVHDGKFKNFKIIAYINLVENDEQILVYKEKLMNSHVIINNKGDIEAIYRKLHLFNVSIPEKKLNLQESEYVQPGQELLKPIKTPVGFLGLSICYDLRFPEVNTLLRENGADILSYPSAFTTSTGEAHWKILLQARAIESQCYVVAPAQYGQHNEKRVSYGNAMIIDPWGSIVAECKPYCSSGGHEDESIIFAAIDQNKIETIRKEMPVFNHRRNDVYSLKLLEKEDVFCIDDFKYNFAHIEIPSSTVFYRSKHSYAFTNLRCVIPGHVLVSSLRSTKRLVDLTKEERDDFFEAAVKVQQVLESLHNVNSSTICIQDGKNAGQSIPHVHCHILPRKENDFQRNDDVYEKLAKHDQGNDLCPPRSIEEMTSEAAILRPLFLNSAVQQ